MTTRKKVSKNEKHIKTTKKKGRKNVKRINQTAHQRAMSNPEAQRVLKALRASWSALSPQQRDEQLKVLIGFKGTTMAGIARDLGQPPTTIRRHIKPASDWLADMLDAWADDPQEQSERGADQYACHFPPKIPAWKKLAPVINEKSPAQDDAHISTAQQTKKITLPISIRAKEPPVVKDATSGQEDKVGKGTPVSSNVDAYIRRQQILDEKAQRLTAMIDEIPPRPIYSAKSMKRQGKSEPS
jgi:hypothetical protein